MSWLKPTPKDQQYIQQLEEEQPELYFYAQVLAMALRIDTRLLRNLRLHFLPKSSVELETELWFSPLIHTRNVQTAVINSDIARTLCDALKNENLECFTSVKAEIDKLTHHWTETDRIEQEIRWAVIEEDNKNLQKNVKRILKAITKAEEDSEKRELARWVKGTLPSLAGIEQITTEQQWLSHYVVAALGMTVAWWGNTAELYSLPESLIKALPKGKTQKVGLRLRPGVLEVLKPEDGLAVIDVSVPLPTTVILEFKSISKKHTSFSKTNRINQVEPFWIGKVISIPKNTQSFNLRMLDGTLVHVTYKQNHSPKVFISYSHKDVAWKERLQSHLAVLEIQGLLSVWEDRQIALGDAWYPEIEQALNTADVAILLISADFLTSKFILEKEVPRLLERREREGIRVIPLVLKPCPWRSIDWLSTLHSASQDNVYLSYLPEHEQDTILSKLVEQVHDWVTPSRSDFIPEAPTLSIPTIHSDRLPTVKGGFFGREAELQLLNDSWTNEKTRIVQLIAPAGMGKTKLLRHWIDHTSDIPVLIAWSFYSQGASEDRQISATPFFNHAFEMLGSSHDMFASEEDKGDHLAQLLRGKRYVLVLDGLESLQHVGRGMRGELKDRAIRQLLRSLVSHSTGLCIITTRIAVHELSDRHGVITHDLQSHSLEDGINLLMSLGVHGSRQELANAVKEYAYHPLALNLLGNMLRLRYKGDVRSRDTLKTLVEPISSQSCHAFKVMQAYEEWFTADPEHGPELALLHLLGLFDHPIGQEVLQVLWDAQIPHLTAGIEQDDWLDAIAGLREEHHLLSQHDGSTDLDCHPLIREYFGRQLQAQQPDAWRRAHETLYGYYKALPEKELPDTLEEMQPLFSAVAHGCAAGLHQQAFEEIYWPRILRKNEFYNIRKLGAFSDDLATLLHFFTTPWHTPVASLTEATKAAVLNWAGFDLRALGRLREALEPMQAGMEMQIKNKDWKSAANASSKLSELQLTLGEVAAAHTSGQHSVNYADQSGDMFWRMGTRTAHADALHQAGETAAALALFRKAEQLQQEHRPEYPRLYSLQGFQYCDLLLAQGGTAEVLERAEQSLEWGTKGGLDLLSIALDQLTLGRAHLQQSVEKNPPNLTLSGEKQEQAAHWLDQAVTGLRAAGRQDCLPLGLLARSALHRHTRDFALARQDLQEVFDIAKPSRMRLFLVDWHLEMARLLIAEGQHESDAISGHISFAAKLISETGYHRRDAELAELQKSTISASKTRQ